MSLSEILIEQDYFKDLKKNISHNYQIAEFYENLFIETDFETFLNKSKSVDSCCKWWDTYFYKMQNVKDIKRVNLCRDKFCFNCQSMLASKRQSKFGPILDSFRKDYDVYHMVVTVRNCDREELLPLLNRMYKKFPFFMRYFKGAAKVKGMDFRQYGYAGAVRGLEITQNQETKQYHPHFHCMVLFKKGLQLEKRIINSYSYDKGVLVRKFSDLEVLLQKLWFLLMHDVKVTKKALEDLKEGYSVKCDDSKGNYHECFKYACKGAFDSDKGAFIYKEHEFRALQHALNGRRMIQGYGLLYNFDDQDGEILEADVQAFYDKYIEDLQQIEKPEFHVETLDDVIDRSTYCKYISKSNIKRLMVESRRQMESESE